MNEKKDKSFFEKFNNSNVEIILSNGMHYSGLILSVGDDYIKIRDKYEKIVFIVLEQICSVMEVGK